MRRRLLSLLPLLALAGALGWWAITPVAPTRSQLRREAEATPKGFVYVPGGECWIGTDDEDAEDEARPRRRVWVPSFYLGRTEVTQVEWKRFRPEHLIPTGCERQPITNVLRQDAEAYCRWVGGRLPADREWEKAARGTDGRRYPWGDQFDKSLCNLARVPHPPGTCLAPGIRRGLKPVDAYAAGASPYGALQMAGNAWEWVSDPFGGDAERGIIRGGAVGYSERDARTYSRSIEGAGVT